jgi:NAD(P)-dependent dehydrogenase (short-subunit alcohol dehydrogenase family)
MDFTSKTVVVTGVGREGQVGEAVARAFAERGALLVLVGRKEAEVGARAAALVRARHRATAHACDLTDEAAVAALARQVGEMTGGRVDALVNVAGGFAPSGPVAESAFEGWEQQLATNLTTAYLATRAFLPALRAARGSVVFFGAAAALPGGPAAGIGAYLAAKCGVHALTRAVAEEERASGVRANALAPTAVRTASNLAAGGDAPPPALEPDALAEAAVFLCSEAARGVSGEIIRMA